MSSDLSRGDLWPEGPQMGSGGQLSLEDSKSTSAIGYYLPFPYPHLFNWHIDQLALCTLFAAIYSVYSECCVEQTLLLVVLVCRVIILKVHLCLQAYLSTDLDVLRGVAYHLNHSVRIVSYAEESRWALQLKLCC